MNKKSEVDRNVTELSKRYGPKFPAMQAALREQEQTDRELRDRLSTVARGFYNNYQAALTKERNIQGQISSTQNRLRTVSRKAVRLRELEREVEANRQLYDLFLSRGKRNGRIQ